MPERETGKEQSILKWAKAAITVTVILVLTAMGVFAFVPALVEKSRNIVAKHGPYPVSERARALHADRVVGDGHADTVLWNRDLTELGGRQVDVSRLSEGGVAFQVFTAVTGSPPRGTLREMPPCLRQHHAACHRAAPAAAQPGQPDGAGDLQGGKAGPRRGRHGR